jgi:hypothetical protein
MPEWHFSAKACPFKAVAIPPRLPSVPMMSTIKARTGDRVASGAPSAAARLVFETNVCCRLGLHIAVRMPRHPFAAAPLMRPQPSTGLLPTQSTGYKLLTCNE